MKLLFLQVVLPVTSLVISASASPRESPVFTVPLKRTHHTGSSHSKRVRNTGHTHSATSLGPRIDYGAYTAPASGIDHLIYVVEVGIGEPPEFYNLIADTGSSNSFCGAYAQYVRTSTSIPTGETVAMTYMKGSFGGVEYLDQVTLTPTLVIANQSIGDALSFDGFPKGYDGILGLGPVGLTRGTLSPDRSATIPTIMNNLASQGLIRDQILGVYFAPQTQPNDTNGALNFGGTDSSLYEGELTWIPVTKAFRTGSFWGIDLALCTYGDFPIIPNPTTGIVDTGSTLITLANDYFSAYMDRIPGAAMDDTTGLLEIPASAIPFIQPLNFTMGGQVFTLDVAAQLFQPFNPDTWYSTVGPSGANSGVDIDFSLGVKFVERYYSAFDSDDQRVGFAPAKFTRTPSLR